MNRRQIHGGWILGCALAGVWGVAGLAGCDAEDGGEDPICEGDGCDENSDLTADIKDRADPIAGFLKAQKVAANGEAKLDFPTVLFGVAKQQGCADSSIKTFIVSDDLVSGGEAFPRLISVTCVTDNAKASDFFIAASFEARDENNKPTGEIDLRDVEMFAWDANARKFNFYMFQPVRGKEKEGLVKVNARPTECVKCHLTPTDIAADGMGMTPIFNEINQPWTHWNAEPGFPSHGYDLPARVKKAKSFTDFGEKIKAPASRFEEIIKFGGHEKVAAARIRTRSAPATMPDALNMLRPLFCSEQINYATEDFDSGVVPSGAVVDAGIRNMFKAFRPDNWPWGWVNDERNGVGIIRLPAPDGDKTVEQIPMRGNADLLFEQKLVAFGVFKPENLLRVRALDWQKALFSEFRCKLWKDGRDRLLKSGAPKLFPDGAKLADALPAVFDALLVIDGVPIKAGAADKLISLGDASAANVAALKAALMAGNVDGQACSADGSGFCAGTMVDLGNQIDAFVQGITGASDARRRLAGLRDPRICHVLEEVKPADDRFGQQGRATRFSNRPSLPAVNCK